MVEISGYTIEKELGRGGMATVYAAMQQSVERRVALKVMSKVLLVDSSFSERFMREARIAASLYHPHVVAVHDVGVHDDSHYIAMEYLSGGDLAARCGKNIQLVSIVRVVREIASALHYAHSKGFVHRDVKPENILFRDDGSAVLTDFGIARAVNSATQMTRTGAVIGTPQYMSPEQARGKDLDGRSDLYGLGIVFYEMLTGKVPFEGHDSVAVGIQHVTEPVPRLPDKLAYIQPLLEKFLAKRPEDRYQSGGEALIDLKDLERRVLSGEMPAVVGEPPARKTRISQPDPEPPTRAMPSPLSTEPPTRPLHTPGQGGAPGGRKSPPPVAPSTGQVLVTPRPDGSVRREPRLGAIEDIGSFDRTIGQPRLEPVQPAGRPFRWGRLLAVVLVAALAGVGVWQYDRLIALIPNREVDRWLVQAQQAGDFGRWYGDSNDFANVLYQKVLRAEPGNRSARAGMELVGLHLCDRAERAIVDGNPRQAELLLQRAREIAPQLPRITEVSAKLLAPQSSPAQSAEAASAETTLPVAVVDNSATIDSLLGDAATLVISGKLVRPPTDSALARFQAVLALDAGNSAARQGINQIVGLLRDRFDQAMAVDDLAAADDALTRLAVVADDSAVVQAARQRLQGRRDERRQAAAARQVRESRIAQLLDEGQDFLRRDRLSDPPGENASDRFRAVLRADPANSQARAGLQSVARRYLALTNLALEDDRLDEAQRIMARIEDLNPDLPGLERARRLLNLYREQRQRNVVSASDQARIGSLLLRADAALAAGQLMSPLGESAYDTYKAVLRIDPDHTAARQGLLDLSAALVAQSRELLALGNLAGAIARFVDADQIAPGTSQVILLRARLAAAARDETRVAISSGRLVDAEQSMTQASDLEPDNADLAQLQLELNIARDGGG